MKNKDFKDIDEDVKKIKKRPKHKKMKPYNRKKIK